MKTNINTLSTSIRGFLNKGQERSVKARKNIIGSIGIKGASILISFVMVPLTLDYVSTSSYGIWLTLSSIVGWFSFFDIGLTQGLRNKFAEAKARGDDESAQVYVSTTYAILGIIFAAVWALYLIFSQFLDWSSILKVSDEMRSEVTILALIVFTYFCLHFVLKIITTIVVADQQPAKSSLIDLLGQIVSLIFIGILVLTTEGSLINLGVALCLSPLLVLGGANLFLFNGVYKKFKPTLAKVDFSHSKGLFNLGMTFFVIQIAGIIQYQSANVIIARNFGTEEVTSYNIVYKYFLMINMIFTIFLTPFWSASTDAYAKQDFQWIKNGIKKYKMDYIIIYFYYIIHFILNPIVFL